MGFCLKRGFLVFRHSHRLVPQLVREQFFLYRLKVGHEFVNDLLANVFWGAVWGG